MLDCTGRLGNLGVSIALEEEGTLLARGGHGTVNCRLSEAPKSRAYHGGTKGSNPACSSGESDANLTNTRRKRRPTGRQGLPLEGGEDRHEPVHLIAVGRERHQHRGGDAGAPLLDPFADARRRAI
jgi:hypothetical protein